MIRKLVAAASGLLVLGCSTLFAADAPPPIERIAPENSIVIIGAKNMQTTMDRFKRTGLYSLWQTDEMKKWRADAMKEMAKGMSEMFQELGVEEDSLVPPTGSVGIAVFPVINEELGSPEPSFLIAADYGDNADKTDKLIVAAIEKGEKDGQIEFEKKDINGKTFYVMDLSKLEAKEKKEFDDMDMGGGPIPMPDAGQMMESFKKMHYVRDGNSLFLAPDLNALTDALDAAEGKGKGGKGPVAERADFQAVMGKIGDPDVYAVLLTRDIAELAPPGQGAMMMAAMKPMVRSIFGEVQGYGLGMRIDAASAMTEQTFAVLMPNGKAGLTTLVDEPTPRGKLPSFVGADAVSYSRVNFEFGNLMDVVKKVITSNPMMNAQVGEQLPMIEQQLGPIFASLGGQIHIAAMAAKPYTVNSKHSIFAIECVKPQDFENAFGQFAGQMGLEPRDFLGQRIYTMSPEIMAQIMPVPMGGEGGTMSLGIGGGYVMLGATDAVEAGLRATSQNDAASGLTPSKDFQRGVNVLGADNAIAWGWSDTITALEVDEAVANLQAKKSIEDMKASNEPGAAEAAAAMEEGLNESAAIWKAINFELLRRYIGPSAWQITSNQDGFIGRFYTLGAEQAPR